MPTPAETAKSAAEVAKAAAATVAAQARAAAEAERRKREDRSRKFRENAFAYGRRLLDDSPLGEWFPGATWRWVDYPSDYNDGQARYVVAPEAGEQFDLMLTRSDQSGGGEHLHLTDPDNGEGRTVRVFWTSHERDSTGYLYWSSSPVRDPADIGRILLERERSRS